MTETQTDVGVPSGLIDAVLYLVSTGPVPLGGYSVAEMVAVDAVVDFLDEMPSEEEVGEAVRSLAARQLLVALPGTERLQVRGDLRIAVVFQQRARWGHRCTGHRRRGRQTVAYPAAPTV